MTGRGGTPEFWPFGLHSSSLDHPVTMQLIRSLPPTVISQFTTLWPYWLACIISKSQADGSTVHPVLTTQSCPSNCSAISSSLRVSESGKGLMTRKWKNQEWDLVSRAHLWGHPVAQYHCFLILCGNINFKTCTLTNAHSSHSTYFCTNIPFHLMPAFCLWGLYSPSPQLCAFQSSLWSLPQTLRILGFSPNILSCLLERLRRGMGFEILPSWVPVLPFTRYVTFEKITLISLIFSFLIVSEKMK